MIVEISRAHEYGPKQSGDSEPFLHSGGVSVLPPSHYDRFRIMSEVSPSPYLAKIAAKIIPELKVLRGVASEKDDGYRMARSALLLPNEMDSEESRARQMNLIAGDFVRNMPDGYNTGKYADRWAQSFELAALKEAYPDSLGWFLNNPGNSSAVESVALLRRNFPEYVTNPGLKDGTEGQPDIFIMINSGLIAVNRRGSSERPWEDLDMAVNLARAFPERRGELEVEEVRSREGKVVGEGKFWDVMKGMMDQALSGELLKKGDEPNDLTVIKAEKVKQEVVKLRYGERARTVAERPEDRYDSNEHALLVIAAGLVRLFPERRAELGLTVDEIRIAEAQILHRVSFPFNSGTQREVIANGEMFKCAVLLEKNYGSVFRFANTRSVSISAASPNSNNTA